MPALTHYRGNRFWLTMVLLFFSLPTLCAEVITTGPYSYKLSVETSAKKSTVWRLWEDVENWKKYDTILEYSYLVDGAAFEKGAIGYVNARGAPKTKFELLEVNPGVSFDESLKLPLFSSLLLRRYFEPSESGPTIFTHEVEFKGPARWLMYRIMAKTFRKELPLVMGNLRDVAELEESQEESPAVKPE